MEIRTHTSASPPAPAPAATDMSAPTAARSDAVPSKTAVIAVKKPEAASAAEADHALKNINQALKERAQDLEFSFDEDSARTIVKVVDKHTQEVIRQMPTREALEIAKALDRLQSLLVRQQA